MKRTKHINRDSFRKSFRTYRLAPVALAVSAVFMLSGCEQADESVSLFKDAEECKQVNPSLAEQCTTAYNTAQAEAVKTAPKYASREDCVAEFGESQCVETPAQAGVGATSQSSHSTWMPLMAGYMMGRMMSGGYGQSPLFTSNSPNSPARGKFVDATGKSFGNATTGRTMKVDKSALAPKPATTTTVTRGGFGESVAKQNAATRSTSTSSSSRSSSGSRSFGG
ncbi:UPF0441 protein [Leminorella grimontii]|uniref:UPF0441 protein n=1 Tax=Leminorella grimontii TaxID=82981 RepID=A0AAV5N900_9GAMM|nr:DUF1190 family protein [Leminorella grimontii]KFC94902.1 uncharacterized UPF0441 family protein [Leminorella grimontii ATCC 33999 = DSM 5078]GKX56867.1 UPF0441 protein [Leminorella grimontii]GKX60815.1 UPF0441 protein [Leminorella grimontii]VFS61050.1 Protein of uncharacterised function (DUF1190) [Leminorella grimontii]